MARKGEGLYQRGKVWMLDFRHQGIRHVFKIGKGISRSVAGEIATTKRAQVLKGEAGIGRKKKDLPFKDAREKFEAWIEVEKRPNTVRRYKQCLKQLACAFGERRLSSITPWALERYKKERVVAGSPIGVNRELGVLKTLFNRCKSWGLIDMDNPVRAVKLRKETKTRLRWLSPEEEGRLLAVAEEPLRSIIVVGLHTGLRLKSEGLQLRWDDIDLKRGQLVVAAAYAKNGQSRTVPLNSIVRQALEQLHRRATGPFVFAKADGSPYRSIRSAFATACRRAGLVGVSAHVLRHSFASRLAMSGADMRTIQDVGGWRTLGMVERYSHLAESHKAAAVEKLAAISQRFSQQPETSAEQKAPNLSNTLGKLA